MGKTVVTDETTDIEINIDVRDVSGEGRTFTTVRQLREFIEVEQKSWQEQFGKFASYPMIQPISDEWSEAKRMVIAFEISYSKLSGPDRVEELKRNKTNLTERLKKTCFSASSFTSSLLKVCNIGAEQAGAFWNSTITKNINNGGWHIPFRMLEGAIMAYEYLHSGETELLSRRDSEERSLATLRRELTDKNDEVSSKSKEMLDRLADQISTVKDKYEKWQSDQEQLLTAQKSEIADKSKTFFTEAQQKISDLEQLYTEKLRLEAPAQHWRTKAAELRKAGLSWGGLLLFFTVGALVLFVWLFNNWLTSGEMVEQFSTRHWQGIILLFSVLSLVAYLLRTFGRLTFSAFHLQRDAEEREQLALVYLALAKETTISDDARRVVMQSLFSRTDSGLLPGDHGPTMPNVTELASNITRK